MARFLRNKSSLSLGLMFFLGFYFFFSPFLHFHPHDAHAHGEELHSHHHEGHFHSHELEAIAHAWHFHPLDKQQDHKHHHPHSAPEHDSDKFEFTLKKPGLHHKSPVKTKITRHKEYFSTWFFARSSSRRIKEILLIEFPLKNDPEPFQERSPPYLTV